VGINGLSNWYYNSDSFYGVPWSFVSGSGIYVNKIFCCSGAIINFST